VLALAALAAPSRLHAQVPAAIALTVEDASGAAVSGAIVTDAAGKPLGSTDASGNVRVSCAAPCQVKVAAPGFATQTLALTAPTTIHLDLVKNTEQVTVTAYKTPLGELESPVTSRVLSAQALRTTPAITLDDQLRQLPGVELFRRSSSLVANPTSQGVSLRGLGSTSASRTLVTEDDVPLNDPLGGWLHWQEQPELAIHSIEMVRGGASSLYGSSAIGGVINVVPARPASDQAELSSSYGGEGTYDDSLLAQAKRGPWGVLGAGGLIGTDGYIQEAPAQRGPVDVASNVHSQNAEVLAEHDLDALRLFVRVNGFNELRHNGTPYQFNGTRLVRYSTGGDWETAGNSSLGLRLFGSDERYRQTFSSLSNAPTAANPTCAYRCGETPTKYSYVPDNELGASAHWSQPLTPGLLLLAGADVRDIRVWDTEESLPIGSTLTDLHDHQRDTGLYTQLMWVRRAWTVTAAGRVDWYQNFDGQSLTLTDTTWSLSATQPPQRDENLFDPRVGISRKIGSHWALSASAFRAFRQPTASELYRATQVGAQLTLPNGNLLSERATGAETGVAAEHNWGTVRASYFFTRIDRPIVALLLSTNRYMRENLGQIDSQGLSLDYELMPLRWLAVNGGYQYAHAVDHGDWIPEVARNMATMNVRAFKSAIGTLNLEAHMSGRQFDDDANQFLLHGYFRLDAYGSHDFGDRLEIFAAGENLFDRSIEVSKTPTTTLGQPRVARVGFQLRVGREGN
jgi:outer membrane receptor protein involved in Fe transport